MLGDFDVLDRKSAEDVFSGVVDVCRLEPGEESVRREVHVFGAVLQMETAALEVEVAVEQDIICLFLVAGNVDELFELFIGRHVDVVNDIEFELFHESLEAEEGSDLVEHGVDFDVISLLPDFEQHLSVDGVDVVVLQPDAGCSPKRTG